jgi:hypothetical protein
MGSDYLFDNSLRNVQSLWGGLFKTDVGFSNTLLIS